MYRVRVTYQLISIIHVYDSLSEALAQCSLLVAEGLAATVGRN